MCATCDDLRRQLREEREELAEWARAKPVAPDDGLTLERLHRWCTRLKTPKGPTRLVIALADASPRVLTPEALLEIARSDGDGEVWNERNMVRVYVWRARRGLAAAGLSGALETVWGAGYVVPADQASRLKAAMGDAA